MVDIKGALKSRRVWGAICAAAFAVLMVLFPNQEGIIKTVAEIITGSLGIALPVVSWSKPK